MLKLSGERWIIPHIEWSNLFSRRTTGRERALTFRHSSGTVKKDSRLSKANTSKRNGTRANTKKIWMYMGKWRNRTNSRSNCSERTNGRDKSTSLNSISIRLPHLHFIHYFKKDGFKDGLRQQHWTQEEGFFGGRERVHPLRVHRDAQTQSALAELHCGPSVDATVHHKRLHSGGRET